MPRTSGTYTFTYTICEIGAIPANCQEGTASVTVSNTITANNDDLGTITASSTTSVSVLDNDTLNGSTASTTHVTVTPTTTLPTGLTLNPDGKVSVAPTVPSGTYTFTYTICEIGANPANCQEGTASVTVSNTVTPINTMMATTDDFTSNPVSPNGGTAGNVLTNDRYNGQPIVSSDVTITVTDPQATGVRIDADGNLIVPANLRSGNYTITYTVCHNTTNVCGTATITFGVASCELVIYNGLSVNGDGRNDSFVIGGVECYPDNDLMIFNRWGVKVYEKSGYNNVDDVFRGISSGRSTVEASKGLPQGTYYYIFNYADQNGNRQTKTGWLFVR